ncbi:MAG: RluA family pseudouridine synthase [Deltaproteobacteria bacterium]|nr:RluA family pseudouridine synthase [Deltaproteobacteria bacterium]
MQQRLDRFLALLERWGSRARVQRLIQQGAIRVDGRRGRADEILRLDQIIEVEDRQVDSPLEVHPEDIRLDILYEDQWLLVLNKPPGMVVHPAPGHARGTLVAGLLHHLGNVLPGLDPLRPGIVHRLDKDTSGVLLVAKDARTLEDLAKQFRDRVVEKQYVAAVHGKIRQRSGTITQPIGRNPKDRKRMAVVAGGRSAETRYEVLGCFDAVTIVRLFPKTGRTHQLRVHLASIGHPILGDALYSGARSEARQLGVHRQALHAERIAFMHPHTHARVAFTAPLADDLRGLWKLAGTLA